MNEIRGIIHGKTIELDTEPGLPDGEPVIVTVQPVTAFTGNGLKQWPCKAGSAKDTPHWMAPDFDAPLEEFREYME